jgi:hypothetical protein
MWRGISSFSFLAHGAAPHLGPVAVDHDGERVDRLVVHQDLHLDEVVLAVADHLVVEAGIALGHRFQPVVEVEDDLVQRQVVDHHGAAAGIGEVQLLPRRSWQSFSTSPRYSSGTRIVALIRGSSIWSMVAASGMSAGLCSSIIVPSRMVDVVDDRGRGGDEVDIVFAFQPVADDLEVQEPEEAAAEAEAEGGGGLHLEGEGLASFRASFSMASRRSSKSLVSTGKRPQKTTGTEGLKPGSAVSVGLRSWVIVSPTRVSRTCLIER